MKRYPPVRIFTLTITILIVLFLQFSPISIGKKNNPSTPLTGSEITHVKSMANVTTKANEAFNPAYYPFQVNRPGGAIAAPPERFFTSQIPEVTAPAWEPGPGLQALVNRVQDGEVETARGVFVEGVLAVPVRQQPTDDPAFVSTENDTVTQFKSAAVNGVTGLLAHNFLTGIQFYKMEIGQEVDVVYGDGHIARYQIDGIFQFQKLDPDNLRSDLINLKTGKRETTNQVFSRFYAGEDHVTFQTCLERDGLSSWGLTFVVADPLS